MKKKIIVIFLMLAVLLSGCSKAAGSSVSADRSAAQESAGSAVADGPVEYDPHLWAAGLDKYYKDNRKESLFNLIDALRAGEDTFKCESREIYDWCTDDVTLGELFPVACMVVTGGGDDGYADGVGKIRYKIPKDEFLEREKEFERDVNDIISSNVKQSYSDFEKCLALYDYMATNFRYNYDWPDDTPDGFVYHCFETQQGICGEIASVYTYLLMASGVDAVTLSCDGEMYHSWTFVMLGGKGYHIDPTWGLRSENGGDLFLRYFLITDEDRTVSGFDLKTLTLSVLADPFCEEYKIDLTADDDSYSYLWDCSFVSMDTDRNTVECMNGDEAQSFKYE